MGNEIDLSKLSQEELEMIANNNLSGLSANTLSYLAGEAPPPEPKFLEEKAANIPFKERFVAKNLAVSPEAQVQYLKEKLPKFEFQLKDGEVFARPIGGNYNYKALDPKGFDVQDISDVAYDIGAGGLQAGATALGALGGPVVAALSSAASGAGLEGLRQKLGEQLGIKDNVSPKEIAMQGAMGLAAPAAEKLIAPVAKMAGKGVEAVGDYIYKNAPAIRKANELAKEYSKIPVSDVLQKYGISGRAKKISDKADKLIDILTKKRDSILKEATDAGVKTESNEATKRGMNFLMEIDDPKVFGASESVDNLIGDLAKFEKTTAGSSPKQMTESAKRLYKKAAADSDAFRAMGNTDEAARFFRQVGLGARDSAKEAVSKWNPEKGAQLSSLNDELASLLTAREVLQKEGAKAGPSIVSSIDGMIVGAGNPAMLAAKKAADVSKTTWARTNAGAGIKNLGKAVPKTSTWQAIMLEKAAKDKLEE